MDDTLYPLSSGLNLACRKNIEGMVACVDKSGDVTVVMLDNE